MDYAHATYETYHVEGADLSAAGTLLNLPGPPGAQGRLHSVSAVVTTVVTVADATVSIGDGTVDDAYGSLLLPFTGSSSGDVVNTPTLEPADDNLIPADSAVVVKSDGGGTTGAAALTVVIAWFTE